MAVEPVSHRRGLSANEGAIEPRLPLGHVVATYGALRKMLVNGIDPHTLLTRHATGDWSEMDADDRKATEAIVRAYILEHPEILQEAAAVLQRRETSSNLASAGDQLHTPFAGAQAGNPAGDVTVVEFSDYNCGFCRSSVADVARLVRDDKGIKLIYREVPILAPSSKDAALWALAAAKQGKHAAFHSAMFSGGRPDAATIRAAAIRAGMDLATAENFIKTKEAVGELQNNVAMMRQIGFSGTPTFIIGDQIIEGALGHDALKAAVAKARKNKV